MAPSTLDDAHGNQPTLGQGSLSSCEHGAEFRSPKNHANGFGPLFHMHDIAACARQNELPTSWTAANLTWLSISLAWLVLVRSTIDISASARSRMVVSYYCLSRIPTACATLLSHSFPFDTGPPLPRIEYPYLKLDPYPIYLFNWKGGRALLFDIVRQIA